MDEPGFLLRAVTWHIGSGDAVFTGWALLLLSAMMHARGLHGSRVILVAVLGIAWLVLANGTSLSGALAMLVLGLCVLSGKWLWPAQRRMFLTLIVSGILFFAGLESVWHQSLDPIAPDAKSVAIIGDSVSAGLNAVDVTWPRQLAQSTGHAIYDASQQGATVKSALTQLDKLDGRGDLLWIEIGGNDILESLPVDVYAERLEALLQAARKRYRTVVMMEIPAPPGGRGYGVTQRTLSKKYGIPLVPKRQFLAVLTTSGSTQDGVHLANAGHQRMASLVRKTLGWADGQHPGEYQRVE